MDERARLWVRSGSPATGKRRAQHAQVEEHPEDEPRLKNTSLSRSASTAAATAIGTAIAPTLLIDLGEQGTEEDPMSTYPPAKPIPGITFTPQGNRALDRMAAGLVGDCDGSPASIADILEQVLSADIEELADLLTENPALPDPGPVDGPIPGSPDQAARRRLDEHQHAVRHTHPQPPSVRR
jgi:hypothetical protein